MSSKIELADLPTMDREIRERAFNYRTGRGGRRSHTSSLTGGGGGGGFTGDFGSLFTGVLHYLRSDLGITQSSGNITGWAAQVGPSVAPAAGCTYIGTVGAGLNSHASVIANGTDQGGAYTLDRPAPATTPTFVWAVWRLLGAPSVPSRLFSDQDASMGGFVNSGTTDFYSNGNGALGPVVAATNTWGRSEQAFTGAASASIKFGSAAAVTGSAGNSDPNSLRGIFCTNLGAGKINAELLCFIMLDNIPSAPTLTTASAAVTTFYGGSVAV